MNALQLVRNCLAHNARAAIPQGVVRRSASAFVHRPQAYAPAARRMYSTEKGKEKEEQAPAAANGEEKPTSTNGDAAVEDDVAAKLLAKQDEVIELTVHHPISFFKFLS